VVRIHLLALMRCTKCLQDKPEEDFHRCSARSSGRASWCKTCKHEIDNGSYSSSSRRREAVKTAAKATRLTGTRFVYEYLMTHPCVDCGETDPIVLQFDHVDPLTKKHNVSNLKHRSPAGIMREIDKCVVRCANCHARITAKQFGWYATIMEDGS
jgi:hypothetical protein